MPLRTAAYVVAASLVDREAGRAAAIREVNAEGLEGLYEILVDSARPEWVAALRVSARPDAAAALLFPCCWLLSLPALTACFCPCLHSAAAAKT